MKKKHEIEEKVFVVGCEIRQQILDIIAIVIVFFVAMLFGKVCMNHYGGRWFLFYTPTFMLIISGMGIWDHLKKRSNKKRES